MPLDDQGFAKCGQNAGTGRTRIEALIAPTGTLVATPSREQ
jgi:hypothetical protein